MATPVSTMMDLDEVSRDEANFPAPSLISPNSNVITPSRKAALLSTLDCLYKKAGLAADSAFLDNFGEILYGRNFFNYAGALHPSNTLQIRCTLLMCLNLISCCFLRKVLSASHKFGALPPCLPRYIILASALFPSSTFKNIGKLLNLLNLVSCFFFNKGSFCFLLDLVSCCLLPRVFFVAHETGLARFYLFRYINLASVLYPYSTLQNISKLLKLLILQVSCCFLHRGLTRNSIELQILVSFRYLFILPLGASPPKLCPPV